MFAEQRPLVDYTRLRIDLTRERTGHWQRLEKLLESALPRSGQYSVAADRHDFE